MSIVATPTKWVGKGLTEQDPRLIESREDFHALNQYPTPHGDYNELRGIGDRNGFYYKLMVDIDFGGDAVQPTGFYTVREQYRYPTGKDPGGMEYYPNPGNLTIKFDGNGHKIHNGGAHFNPNAYVSPGLFDTLGPGGVIKNLTVEDLSYTSYPTACGAIIGKINGGTMTNCHVVNCDAYSSTSYTGCFAGQMIGGSVTKCTVTGGKSETMSVANIGGFVGSIQAGSISGCGVRGTTIKSAGTGQIAGFVGLINSAGSIADSYALECTINTGSTNSSGFIAVKGNTASSVTRCYSASHTHAGTGAVYVGRFCSAGSYVGITSCFSSTLNLSAPSDGFTTPMTIAQMQDAGVTSTIRTALSSSGMWYFRSGNYPQVVSFPRVAAATPSISSVTYNATNDTITAQWGNIVGNNGYVVETASDAGGPWASAGTTTIDVVTKTFASTVNGVNYIRVRSIESDDYYESAFSAAASVDSTPANTSTPSLSYNPATNLVTVSWTAIPAGVSFIVERSTNGTTGWTSVGANATANNYTFTPPNGVMYVRSRATSNGGVSVGYVTSSPIDTIPAASSGLTVSAYDAANDRISLSCVPVSVATEYRWYWWSASHPTHTQIGVTTHPTVSLYHNGPKASSPGDLHYADAGSPINYEVIAKNLGGVSAATQNTGTCSRKINILSAVRIDATHTDVTFDVQPSDATANTAANWTVDGVTVSSATKQSALVVRLTHQAMGLPSYAVDSVNIVGALDEPVLAHTTTVAAKTQLIAPTISASDWDHSHSPGGRITVTWNDPNSGNHSDFLLEWKVGSGSWIPVDGSLITKDSRTWYHDDCPAGDLSYRITALGDPIVYGDSTAGVSNTVTPVLEVPTISASVFRDADNAITGRIDLTVDCADTVDSYTFYRSDLLPAALGTDLDHDTIMNAAGVYTYTVLAHRGNQTRLSSVGSTITLNLPDSPTLLSAIYDKTSGKTTLVWSNVDAELGYLVDYSINGFDWIDSNVNINPDVGANVLTYQHTSPPGLVAYRVRAENAVGVSGPSNSRAVLVSPVTYYLTHNDVTVNGVSGKALSPVVPNQAGSISWSSLEVWNYLEHGETNRYVSPVYEVRLMRKVGGTTSVLSVYEGHPDGWLPFGMRTSDGSGAHVVEFDYPDPGVLELDTLWGEFRIVVEGVERAVQKFIFPSHTISYGRGSVGLNIITSRTNMQTVVYDESTNSDQLAKYTVCQIRYGASSQQSTTTIDLPHLTTPTLNSAVYDAVLNRTAVSWSPVPDASGYEIRYAKEVNGVIGAYDGLISVAADVLTTNHQFSDPDAYLGIVHYKVIAKGDGSTFKSSPESNTRFITTIPDAPSNLNGAYDSDIADDVVRLYCNKVAGAKRYEFFYWRTASKTGLGLDVVKPTVPTIVVDAASVLGLNVETSFSVPDAENGVVTFSVRAVTAGGTSVEASPIDIDTRAPQPTNVIAVYDPGTVVGTDHTDISVDPVNGVIPNGYHWYIENSLNPGSKIKIADTTLPLYVHNIPRAGSNNYYVVAETSGGSGPFSAAAGAACTRKIEVVSVKRLSDTSTEVVFNVEVSRTSVEDVRNWSGSAGITISNVARQTDKRKVYVTHSVVTPASYELIVTEAYSPVLGEANEPVNTSGNKNKAILPDMTLLLAPVPGAGSYSVTNDQITVQWAKNTADPNLAQLTGNRLRKRINGGAWSTISPDKSVNAIAHTEANPVAGVHEYQVAALGNSTTFGMSLWSASISVTPSLVAPVISAVNEVGTNRVNLAVVGYANPSATFKFFRVLVVAGVPGAPVQITTNTAGAYYDTLVSGNIHRYYAVAVRGNIESSPSTTPIDIQPVAPPAPTLLSAVYDIAKDANVLDWTQSENNNGYIVERATNLVANDWTALPDIAQNTTHFEHTMPTSDEAYHYRVRAKNAVFGNSLPSGVLSVTPTIPSPVFLTNTIDLNNGIVSLSASIVDGLSVDQYRFFVEDLQYAGDPTKAIEVTSSNGAVSGSTAIYRLQTAEYGPRQYWTRARKSRVTSAFSAPVTINASRPVAPVITEFDTLYKNAGYVRIKTDIPAEIFRLQDGAIQPVEHAVNKASIINGSTEMTLSTPPNLIQSGNLVLLTGFDAPYTSFNTTYIVKRIVDHSNFVVDLRNPATTTADITGMGVLVRRDAIETGVTDYIDLLPGGETGTWQYKVRSYARNFFGQSVDSTLSSVTVDGTLPPEYFMTAENDEMFTFAEPLPERQEKFANGEIAFEDIYPSRIISKSTSGNPSFHLKAYVDGGANGRTYLGETDIISIAESGEYLIPINLTIPIKVTTNERHYLEFVNDGNIPVSVPPGDYGNSWSLASSGTYAPQTWVVKAQFDVADVDGVKILKMLYGLVNEALYDSGVRGIKTSDIPLPSKPVLLPSPQTSMSIATGRVDIAFNTVDGAAEYILYRARDNGAFAPVGNPTTAASFIDYLGLETDMAEHTYSYYVTARNVLGESRPSDTKSFKYQIPNKPILEKTDPTSRDGAFTLTVTTPPSTNYPPGGQPTRYRILKNGTKFDESNVGTSTSPFRKVYASWFKTNSQVDTYTVVAFNGAGDSLTSDPITIFNQPPSIPLVWSTQPNLTTGSVTITAQSTDNRTYSIYFYKKTGANGAWVLMTPGGIPVDESGISEISDTITTMGDYYYAVKAHNIAGDSLMSDGTVRVDAPIPSSLVFTAQFSPMTGFVTLACGAINANYYTFYRKDLRTNITQQLDPVQNVDGIKTDSNFDHDGQWVYYARATNTFGTIQSADQTVVISWVGKLHAYQGAREIFFGVKSTPIKFTDVNVPVSISMSCSDKGKTSEELVINTVDPYEVSLSDQGPWASILNLGFINSIKKHFWIRQKRLARVDESRPMMLGDLNSTSVEYDTYVAPVTGLTSTVLSSSSIKLDWTKPFNAVGYKISYKSPQFDWLELTRITDANVLTFTSTNLSADTTYEFAVLALGERLDAETETKTTATTQRLLDITPPTSTIQASPLTPDGIAGWYKSPVVVTLAASDTGGGVRHIKYKINAGSEQTYSSPFTINTNGAVTVTYWAVDIDGNTEVQNTKSYLIDTLAPVVNIGATVPITGGKTVSCTATDIASGVASVKWKVDSGGWVDGTTSGATATVIGTGSYTVYFQATDNAGNTDTKSTIVVIGATDTVPPVTTIAGVPSLWAKTATMSLSALDDVDGAAVAATYYSIDGGAATVYSAPFTINTAGSHTVAYYSIDKAGNREADKSATVRIDLSGPTITTAQVSDGSGGKNVIATVTDAQSGVATVTYQIDGGPVQNGTTANVTGIGSHTVVFNATDTVGNAALAHTSNVTVEAPSVWSTMWSEDFEARSVVPVGTEGTKLPSNPDDILRTWAASSVALTTGLNGSSKGSQTTAANISTVVGDWWDKDKMRVSFRLKVMGPALAAASTPNATTGAVAGTIRPFLMYWYGTSGINPNIAAPYPTTGYTQGPDGFYRDSNGWFPRPTASAQLGCQYTQPGVAANYAAQLGGFGIVGSRWVIAGCREYNPTAVTSNYGWIDIGAPLPVVGNEYDITIEMNANAVNRTFVGSDGRTYPEYLRSRIAINGVWYDPAYGSTFNYFTAAGAASATAANPYPSSENPANGGFGGWMAGTWPGSGAKYMHRMTWAAGGSTGYTYALDNIKVEKG